MPEAQYSVSPARPGAIVVGSTNVATNNRTPFLTIPAGATWVGTVSVVAASGSGTSSIQNSRVLVGGTAGAVPAVDTVIMTALSGRDTAPGVVTHEGVTIVAPASGPVTLDLLTSTATSFAGAASATGSLI